MQNCSYLKNAFDGGGAKVRQVDKPLAKPAQAFDVQANQVPPENLVLIRLIDEPIRSVCLPAHACCVRWAPVKAGRLFSVIRPSVRRPPRGIHGVASLELLVMPDAYA